MVILGIDAGYAIVGYGAIYFHNNSYRPLGFGAITTDADTDFNRRLEIIFDKVCVFVYYFLKDLFLEYHISLM